MADANTRALAPGATVVIGDTTYQLAPLTPDIYAKTIAWVEERIPNPLRDIRAHLEGLEPEHQRILLEKAYEDHKSQDRSMSGEDAQRIMQGEKFLFYHAWLLIRGNHPDIKTPEILEQMVIREVAEGRTTVVKELDRAVDVAAGFDDAEDAKKNSGGFSTDLEQIRIASQ